MSTFIKYISSYNMKEQDGGIVGFGLIFMFEMILEQWTYTGED